MLALTTAISAVSDKLEKKPCIPSRVKEEGITCLHPHAPFHPFQTTEKEASAFSFCASLHTYLALLNGLLST